MLVVSDTSPILNLAVVQHLQLLRQQFETVLIPLVVRAAPQTGWLQIAVPSNSPLTQTLSLELDKGEAAAIALALVLKAEYILMDESEGRAKASALGLRPIGVLGVLMRAKLAGEITSLKEIMLRLRQEAGFFISDSLFEAVLAEVSEN